MEQQRLRVSVTDASDGSFALHRIRDAPELGTERRILYIVDDSLQSEFLVICRKSACLGPEV
jgi:hypothetical protein